jgi:hypothetical protein
MSVKKIKYYEIMYTQWQSHMYMIKAMTLSILFFIFKKKISFVCVDKERFWTGWNLKLFFFEQVETWNFIIEKNAEFEGCLFPKAKKPKKKIDGGPA